MMRDVNSAANVTVVKKVTGADVKAIGFRTMMRRDLGIDLGLLSQTSR